MRGFGCLSSALVGVALLATSVSAQSSSISPIIIKGKHFFYSGNHTQFYIRGVAYQEDYTANGTIATNSDYTDPLSDIKKCNRDIPYLQQLNTNVIRTYAVDPTVDHSACMNAFADAGIYVLSDLSAPTTAGSINRDDPEWTTDIFSRYTALIDNLSQYPNTLGFFAGNEVSNSVNTTAAAAFVAAAVRDSKYYISQKVDSRPLYVGYATSDDVSIRDQIADFLNCNSDVANNVDFFGYNIYSWCGDSSYAQSGYQERTEFFQDYSVPVFFAEYGCNDPEPRMFTEVQALFSEPMTSVWSGGIVYMYFQETNNYGLVTVNDDANTVKTLADFDNLSSQIAKISPTSTSYAAVSTGGTPASCPAVGATWSSTPSPLPPRPNQDLCNCIEPFLGCVVKSSTDETSYGDVFGFICDPSNGNYCGGIAHNSTRGDYGAYGMCAADVQLSYVMNNYFVANRAQAGVASACDFSGAATTQAVQTPTGTCASLVHAAGVSGMGTVPSGLSTQSAIAGAGGNSGGSSGSSGAAASSGSSGNGNAASGMKSEQLDRGLFYLALYVAGAAATGAGMLLL